MRGGPTQFESGLGRYRLHVGDTAHAVGAENLCRLFHRLTQTLGGQFVNGKMQPKRGLWCWRMFVIVVAQGNAFVFKTKSDRVPPEREFFQDLSALNKRRPIAVFAFEAGLISCASLRHWRSRGRSVPGPSRAKWRDR